MVCAITSIFLWFKNHIYRIIQDLSGSSRTKEVQYLKDNSLLLNTRIQNPKMHSLNQLVDSYLHHDTMPDCPPPDFTIPTDLNDGLENWVEYPMHNVKKPMDVTEDDTIITEVLSSFDILEKDGKPLNILFQNEKCPYENVILPTNKEVLFTIVKTCIIVNWRAYEL